MSITIPEIRKSIKDILESNDPEVIELLRKRLVLLLVECLSPNQNRIYQFLEGRDWVTSNQVAESLEWTVFYASTQLKELADMGLIERQPVTGKYGLHYEWRRIQLT